MKTLDVILKELPFLSLHIGDLMMVVMMFLSLMNSIFDELSHQEFEDYPISDELSHQEFEDYPISETSADLESVPIYDKFEVKFNDERRRSVYLINQ